MRLADRHGRPLSEILSEYPDWELPYWAAWMAREPSDGRRVEIALARFMRAWIGFHLKKGKKPPEIEDLVPPDPWRAPKDDTQSQEAALLASIRQAQAVREARKRSDS